MEGRPVLPKQKLDIDDFTAQKTWFLLVTQGENCVSPLGEPHCLVALRAVKSYQPVDSILVVRNLSKATPGLDHQLVWFRMADLKSFITSNCLPFAAILFYLPALFTAAAALLVAFCAAAPALLVAAFAAEVGGAIELLALSAALTPAGFEAAPAFVPAAFAVADFPATTVFA